MTVSREPELVGPPVVVVRRVFPPRPDVPLEVDQLGRFQ